MLTLTKIVMIQNFEIISGMLEVAGIYNNASYMHRTPNCVIILTAHTDKSEQK
jgi:hypothetical protein